MGTFTAQHPDLLERAEKDVFFKRFSIIPQLWSLLFQVNQSTKAYEDRMRVAALGRFAVKAEGTPVAFDDPVSAPVVRTVHTTFALGFRVTEEMMDDDLFDIIEKMPADLGDSARDHMERLAWGLVNDGFNGTTYTGLAEADGTARALFSAAHVNLKTGTVQSNLLAPPVALSITGIEALMTRASNTTSDEDRFINMEQSLLVFNPNLQHQVYVLLETEFRPGTSDNDRSTVVSSRSGLQPITRNGVPYLTSTTAWYIFAPKGQNDLTWNDRRALRFDQAKDADTFDLKHYGSYRASVMFSEWRGAWGSNA
jgi:hypothetical protein